jgi:hypothetical protein
MPQGWEWDETLFRGSARYYERGRLPYPPGLADALAATLGLDGRGRLGVARAPSPCASPTCSRR